MHGDRASAGRSGRLRRSAAGRHLGHRRLICTTAACPRSGTCSHPDERPSVWLRSEDGYDAARVGLEVQTFDKLPADVTTAAQRRRYFDTRKSGKSAAGHLYPDELTEAEKRAVLEYLKTL